LDLCYKEVKQWFKIRVLDSLRAKHQNIVFFTYSDFLVLTFSAEKELIFKGICQFSPSPHPKKFPDYVKYQFSIKIKVLISFLILGSTCKNNKNNVFHVLSQEPKKQNTCKSSKTSNMHVFSQPKAKNSNPQHPVPKQIRCRRACSVYISY